MRYQALHKEEFSNIDFIHRNRFQVSNWMTNLQEQRMGSVQKQWDKYKAAQDRKESMEHDRRKRNMFLLYKWDFVRLKVSDNPLIGLQKQEHMEKMMGVKKQRQLSKQWLIFHAKIDMLKFIFERFDNRRKEILRHKLMVRNAYRIKRTLKHSMLSKGKDIKTRGKKLLQRAFTFTALQTMEVKEVGAAEVLRKFLIDTSEMNSVISTFTTYY